MHRNAIELILNGMDCVDSITEEELRDAIQWLDYAKNAMEGLLFLKQYRAKNSKAYFSVSKDQVKGLVDDFKDENDKKCFKFKDKIVAVPKPSLSQNLKLEPKIPLKDRIFDYLKTHPNKKAHYATIAIQIKAKVGSVLSTISANRKIFEQHGNGIWGLREDALCNNEVESRQDVVGDSSLRPQLQ